MKKEVGQKTKVLANAVAYILEGDDNDTRFEKFANEAVSQIEGGIPVFSTSKTWDLGRDGHGFGRRFEVFVMTSITSSVSQKARSDIERLLPYLPANARLVFCSNQKLSEYAKQRIEQDIRGAVPSGTSVAVLSNRELVETIERFPDALLRFYESEYEDALAAIAQSDEADSSSLEAMRLALAVVADSDSATIRNELYDALVLDCLSRQEAISAREASVAVSGLLGLGRTLPDDVLSVVLRRLEARGICRFDSARFVVTDAGRVAVEAQQKAAVGKLLEGRQLLREAIESELGTPIGEAHFELIWRAARASIASAFYERGSEMVQLLGDLLAGAESQSAIPVANDGDANAIANADEDPSLPFYVTDLADRIAGTSSHPAQQEELGQAVRDVFTDPSTPVAGWLSEICGKFVILCSLGVEHASGSAIADALSRVDLALDTDVVISLLCSGEPQHDAVVAIVKRWPHVGGRLLVAEPVLHEVAHHAWIAEQDAAKTARWLSGSQEQQYHLIENAFVRAFAQLVASGEARPRDWGRYIRQFRGQAHDDYGVVAGVLFQEFKGVSELPSPVSSEDRLESEVEKYLSDLAHRTYGGAALKIAVDKAKRDAKLYASMIAHIAMSRRKEPNANCILVSSARRLARVERKFRRAGENHLVLDVGSMVYLLALVPGVSIGLGAMEAFLFDGRGRRFSGELERSVIRLVRSSDQYRMPWARRTALVREVKNRLLEIAERKEGQTKDDAAVGLLRDAERLPEVASRVGDVLKASLDALAVDTRAENELRKVRKQLAETQEELRRLRDRG